MYLAVRFLVMILVQGFKVTTRPAPRPCLLGVIQLPEARWEMERRIMLG